MPKYTSLLALCAIALSPITTAAPADPTITSPAILPRQNDDTFIGWVQSGGTWYSETCNAGLTWFQDGKYGQCCPATLASCPAPTACVSGSMIYPLPALSTTSTIACTENFGNASYSICNTAFIFENMQDSSPQTDIVCGESSVNWSYYRQVPASVTEAATRGPLSIPQPVSTALVAPNISKTKKGGSKAWIAGAVIGPLLGLALVAAFILLLLRRRKNKNKVTQQGGAAMAPDGVGGYTDAKPQFVQQQPLPQQQAFTPDPYANQAAFATQQQYNNMPVSPSAQHNPGAAPYNASVSPPPQQGYYNNDVKHGYTSTPSTGTAEIGSASGAAPTANAPTHQAAELGGQSQPLQGGNGLFGPSELPSPSSNPRPTM